MERAAKCKHVLVSRHLDDGVVHSFPTRTTHAADWQPGAELLPFGSRLATAKTVGHCPGWLKLFDAAKVSVGGIKQLQSFEHRREWRDLMRDKLTVGIGFHTRTLPALPPLVSVYCFPMLSHDLQWGSVPAYGLSDRRGHGAADCCLPSIGYDY